MSMKNYLKKYGVHVAIWSYALAFILTFGYSFNEFKHKDGFDTTVEALARSMFLPLYWSVKLFED